MFLTLVVNGVLLLNNDYAGPDDDLGIAMALSGLYPASGQCLFTNAVLNSVIYQLNVLVPEFNWFLVIERLASGIAYFALAYMLLRHAPWRIGLPVLGIVAYFIMPKCIIGSNFTIVAALCIAAGEVCFCEGILRAKWTPCLSGLALVTVGYMWRALMLVLSAPFLLLAFAAILLKAHGEKKGSTTGLAVRACGAVLAVGVVVGSVYAYDQSVWSEPPWSEWKDYNMARYELVDYPMQPYEDIEDELAGLGVSESDYWLMRNWITADPDYITPDLLREVTKVAQEPAGQRDMAQAVLDEVVKLAKSFLFTGALVGMVVVMALVLGKRAALIAALSVAGAFAACVVFRYTGRLPLRVEYSTWLYSLLPGMAAALGYSGRKREGAERGARREKVSIALACVMAVLLSAGFLVKWLPTFDAARIDQFTRTSDYVESNRLVQKFTVPGTVFVWDTTSFSQMEIELKYHYLPSADLMNSTVMAGGWTQGSPMVKAHNEALGTPNPIKALIDRPDTYFVTRRQKAIENLRQYLREHYDEKTDYEIVERVPLEDKEKDPLLVVRFFTA